MRRWPAGLAVAALAIAGCIALPASPGGVVALTAIPRRLAQRRLSLCADPGALANSLMLALLAIVFNNLLAAAIRIRWRQRSRPWRCRWVFRQPGRYSRRAAGQFDIDEDDVRELPENIEQQARQRIVRSPPLRVYCGLRVTDRR
ncbi:hypothetical protein MJ585_18680 [Klebsiella pneumoniae]|nr:hypothetical protein MJ585_18680 [Klebsiella pneumoniae]